MPKAFSSRIDSVLAAYKGGDKPKKAKVVNATTSFNAVNNAGFDTDFGSGSSYIQPYKYTDPITGKVVNRNQINTESHLAEPLQPAALSAASGLSNNLDYLNTDPQTRVNNAVQGLDPYYNTLKIENDRATQDASDRARVDAQRTGGSNSTTLGSALGQISNDDILRQNQILTQALQYGNQNAIQNGQFQGQSLNTLAGLVNPLASAANNNLLTAFNAQDRTAQANAAAQNAANLQYQQELNKYNASKSAGLGSGIGSLLGAGIGLAAAPFTGGASLSLIPALSGIGGSAGGLVQGQPTQYSAGGYSPYTFSNPFAASPSLSQGGFNLGSGLYQGSGGFGAGFGDLSNTVADIQ